MLGAPLVRPAGAVLPARASVRCAVLQASAAGGVRPQNRQWMGRRLGLPRDVLFCNAFCVGISRGFRYQNLITGFPCPACLSRARGASLALLDPAGPLQKRPPLQSSPKALVTALWDDCQLVLALLRQGSGLFAPDTSIREAKSRGLSRSCLPPREAGAIPAEPLTCAPDGHALCSQVEADPAAFLSHARGLRTPLQHNWSRAAAVQKEEKKKKKSSKYFRHFAAAAELYQTTLWI